MSSALIVYASRYGCTEKCAQKIASKLLGKVDLLNLKEKKDIDLSLYDTVVIGCPIYMGKMLKEVSEFCIRHIQPLFQKNLELFICCRRDGETAEAALKEAFREDLFNKAVAKECFGGEFIASKMSFPHRLIIKKVAKVDKDTSNILDDDIEIFIQKMNKHN